MKICFIYFLLTTIIFSQLPEFGPGARYPRLTASDYKLWLSWLEPEEESGFALKISHFSSGIWSNPATVISRNDLFVNWADFPSVNEFGRDTLAAHWLEYSGNGVYDYDVRLRFSTNCGKSWTDDIIPHKDGVKAEHGFVSFFPNPDGRIGLAWLDGRNMSIVSDYDHGGGEMALFTSIFENDLGQSTELIIDEKVCECCPTASWWNDDRILIAYRNRNPDETRNINIMEYSENVWTERGAIAEDNWQISGCPVNGPAMAGSNNQVGIIWFTAPEGKTLVKFIQSKNEGKEFGETVILSEDSPLGRVDLTYYNSQFFGSWIKMDEKAGCTLIVNKINNQNGSDDLNVFGSDISCDRGSGYPQIEVWEDRLLVLWTDLGDSTTITGEWISLKEF